MMLIRFWIVYYSLFYYYEPDIGLALTGTCLKYGTRDSIAFFLGVTISKGGKLTDDKLWFFGRFTFLLFCFLLVKPFSVVQSIST